MKQMTFADAEYAGKCKQTRKDLFLIGMDQVVPWQGLIALKGSTVIGHALSKHAGRNPEVWGKKTGSMSTWND